MKRKSEFSRLKKVNSEEFEVPRAERSARRRREETMQACSEIHDASKENKAPAVDGMWCTLVRESTPARLVRFLVNSKKCRTRVLPSVAKKGVKKFEDNSENVVRSVKILYSGGLLSKEKCKSVRSNLSMSTSKQNRKRESLKFMQGVPVPKLLSYNKLIKFIQSIDLHDNVKVLQLIFVLT